MASEKLKAFLTISRAKIQLGTPPHPLLGLLLGAATVGQFLSRITGLYIILYFLLITFACNINCLYDVHIDNKYKQYMSQGVETLGKRTVKGLLIVEGILILSIISYFFYRGYSVTALLALSGLLAGYVYSAEPLRVKKRGLLSPVPVFLGLYTLPVLGGWFVFRSSLSLFIIIFTVGYALLNEGITLVNTCEDYKEDKEEGIKTWAHIIELKNTMRIALIFTTLGGFIAVIGVLLKPFIMGWTPYNIYGSGLFIALGIVNTLVILKTAGDIYGALQTKDLESSCKRAAKNMPKWFISTRYPLLVMVLMGLLYYS
ncbi:MAG: UbiA family prenyltransferase [Candidatus Saliniplasma sp.]